MKKKKKNDIKDEENENNILKNKINELTELNKELKMGIDSKEKEYDAKIKEKENKITQ